MAMEMEEALALSAEEVAEKLTEIAFEMIANVGTARGMYIEAIQEAKKGNFVRARELMAEGKEIFVEGHHAHADVLTMQSAGVVLPNNIFLMHAEDQLMAADSFETIASELIEVQEQLAALRPEK